MFGRVFFNPWFRRDRICAKLGTNHLMTLEKPRKNFSLVRLVGCLNLRITSVVHDEHSKCLE